MANRAAKKPKIDLTLVTGDGCACGACHKRIPMNGGVTFGRPGFIVPAINVCRRCVEIAVTLVGPEDYRTKEGKC